MKKRKFLFFLFILYSFFIIHSPPFIFAVSVTRAQVAPRRGVVIATVDLNRIFAAYPATKKAKEEMGRLILIKENEIAAKRSEVFALVEEIAKIKQTPPPAPPPASAPLPPPPPVQVTTETLPGMSASTQVFVAPPRPLPPPPPPDISRETITQKEAELTKKQEELKTLERAAEKNLTELEQAKTKTILAKIFLGLKELAEEKNVDMIVDKNAILWGAPQIDLTDPLLQKLKSKAIERE